MSWCDHSDIAILHQNRTALNSVTALKLYKEITIFLQFQFEDCLIIVTTSVMTIQTFSEIYSTMSHSDKINQIAKLNAL